MTATLFQSGNDLSEQFNVQNVCVRRMKTNSFDVYTLLHNPDIEIKVRARRGPSEFLGYSENGNSRYVAGIAYDSFDVWVNNREGLRFSSSCIAEDLRSFVDAVQVAQQYNAQQNVAAGAF